MKTIYDSALLSAILPDSIVADEQFRAISKALDEQLKFVSDNAKLTQHLPRLDELTGVILSLLAEQFHVDFFDEVNLKDEQKRNFIRSSISHHRRKGTVAAVEEVVNQFFDAATIDEIGGYLFKISTRNYLTTPAAFSTFVRMLFDAKNVRSWLAGIDLDLSPPKHKICAGGVLATGGKIDIDLRKPRDSLSKVYAGNFNLTDGHVTINPRQPKGSQVLLKVGAPLVVGGQVLIDSAVKPVLRRVKENPIADLAIAGVAIGRGDNIVVPDAYDFIKIFFKFPDGTARRYITIKNPREDVTKAEIKAVGDFAVDNDLLLNQAHDEIISDAPKASLIKKKITVLI